MRWVIASLTSALFICTAPVTAGQSAPAQKQAVIAVSGMVCSSCSNAVETALKKIDGVTAAHADVKADRVTVSYDPNKVIPPQMLETLRKAGYQARWPESPAPRERTPKR